MPLSAGDVQMHNGERSLIAISVAPHFLKDGTFETSTNTVAIIYRDSGDGELHCVKFDHVPVGDLMFDIQMLTRDVLDHRWEYAESKVEDYLDMGGSDGHDDT